MFPGGGQILRRSLHNPGMDQFDRTLLRVSCAVWLIFVGAVIYWISSAYLADDSACDLLSGRITGTLSVGWFPPGRICDYNDGAFVDSPSYLRLVVMAGAVAGPPFILVMARSLRGGTKTGP